MPEKKQMFAFTKDYMEAIAQAWFFTYQHGEHVMDSTDILLGTWQFTKKHTFFNLFWKFLWWKNPSILRKVIDEMYGDELKQLPKQSRIKFTIDGFFHEQFLKWRKKWLKKYSFLVLLHTTLNNLSEELEVYLLHEKIDLEKSKKKLEKIILMLDQVDLSVVEFFNVLHHMMMSMWLKVEQMDMFVDIAQIKQMKWKAGFVMQTWDEALKERGGDEWNIEDIKDEDDDKKLTIEYFATDLTDEASNNLLDPIIGRDKETDQLIYTLLRKTKNNPLLIWEAGVGKTAIVEGLAQRMVENKVPEKLRGKRVMMLDMWALVAGTKYRGEFEARLKAITEEAMDPMNGIILFIDELHNIIWAWSAEGTGDAANILKPLLARGKLQLIGATTFDEYQKHIEKDAALKRRFQELHVDEPSRDVAIEILMWIREKFEEYHGVNISDIAIEKAVDYSIRYMMNKHLPDKAIDIIDEACARLSTLQAKLESNDDYVTLEKSIKDLQKQIEKAIEKQDYFKAAELKEDEEAAKQKLKSMRQQNTLPKHLRPTVEVEHIGKVLSDKLWIPSDQITQSEIHKLANLDKHLQSMILGQDEAVKSIVKAVRRNRLSAVEQKKPIGSFLFLGPSWVGKTYLAKLLAQEFFGSDTSLIRVDMSEFMEKHSSSKMIGSAPGYVGYEEWGVLTEQVRRKPYSVVLFDEIEKASPDVLNVLLQLLDEGHLKDNKGRWIDFKNTIIIMTSNIGSEYFGKSVARIGFTDKDNGKEYADKQFDEMKEKVLEQAKKRMKPELLNRLSEQIVFKPLSKEILSDIFMMKLKDFYNVWKTKPGINLPKFGKQRVIKVIDDIYNPQFGARPIERYLYGELEEQLIQQVMEKEMEKK